MLKVGKTIILLLAVLTVITHSILPHIHLEDIAGLVKTAHEPHHHHDNLNDHRHSNDEDEQPHNLFSFAQLDENFIPGKDQFKKFELPTELTYILLSPGITNQFVRHLMPPFGPEEEYPPPGVYAFNLPSRAPPAFG